MSVSRRTFAARLAGTTLLHAGSPVPSPAAETPAPSPTDAAWRPALFDNHQLETVAVIAEAIVPRTDTPGARDALVHRHLDDILFASPRPVQTSFLEGLSWLDGFSLRTQQKPFIRLDAAEQAKTLAQLLDSTEPELKPGREFVRSMKRWTTTVYYSTEAGHRELNKGGRVPSSYVAACHG